MAEEAARSLTTHDEVDVDDMIAAQIREMEKEIKSEYRHTETANAAGAGKGENGSMAFGHGSLDLSKSYEGFEKKTTLRDSLRSSLGLSLGGARPSEPTVEGTGLKGLLMSDYRLDASLDNVGEAFGGGGYGGGGYSSPSLGSNDGHIAGVGAINEDMEKLLKVLHDDENFQSGKQNDVHVASIGQVADMLETEMTGFMKVVEERVDHIDGVGARSKERDEELREQGRAEARAKNMFGGAYSSAADVVNAAAGKSASDADAELPTYEDAVAASEGGGKSRVDEVAALDAVLGSESFAHVSLEEAQAKVPGMDAASAAAGTGGPLPPRYPMTGPPVTTPASFAAAVGPSAGDAGGRAITSLDREGLNRALVAGWHPVQAAIDKEMSAADEILFRMRSLRTGLSSRLRHLDALSASVMTAPAGTGAAPRSVDGVEAPAMLRSSREHWNGISRVSETAQTQARDKALSANVAPWTSKDHIVTGVDLSHAADSLASIGKEIGTNLDGSLNRLLTILTDSSSPTTASPAPSLVTESAVKAPESSAGTAPDTKANAPLIEESASKSKDGEFGPTLQELNAPAPRKSLLAQIDDIGNTLGKSISVESNHAASSEVQATAGTAFDKFIPQSTRENPFTETPQAPSSSAAAAGAAAVVGGKRKTLSPTPFKTKETIVAPKLYAVQPVRGEAIPQRDDGTKKRIVAPSDEELILRERLTAGGQAGASPLVSMASAPAWVQKVPILSSSSSYSAKYSGAPAVAPEELPWSSEGGASSTLRPRPLEGLAIMSHRKDTIAEKRERSRKAQEEAVEKVAAGEISQSAPKVPQGAEVGGNASLMEREKHLKAMKEMRLNLASIL